MVAGYNNKKKRHYPRTKSTGETKNNTGINKRKRKERKEKKRKGKGTKPRKVRKGVVSRIDEQRIRKEDRKTERDKGRNTGKQRHEETKKDSNRQRYIGIPNCK